MNKKGFMLAEAIVSVAVVMVAFVLVYAQFISSYTGSLKYSSYNNIDKMYLVHSFARFIKGQTTNHFAIWTTLPELNNNGYVDVVDYCNRTSTIKESCIAILGRIGVNTTNNRDNVLFIRHNPSTIKSKAGSANVTSSMRDYINLLWNNTTYSDDYRLIMQFSDGKFATLRINN